MLVIIKSGPDTPEGKRGLKLARDLAADVVLIQNGVYFAQKDNLEGFCGRAFVVDEDCRFRGLDESALEKDISRIDYDELVDAIVGEDRVLGIF
jgi:sulfur relay protein TusB/DsrH